MEQPDAYERQLAGAARRRVDGSGDPELTALLELVRRRRSRRLGDALSRTGAGSATATVIDSGAPPRPRPDGPGTSEGGPEDPVAAPAAAPAGSEAAEAAREQPGSGPAGELLAIERVGPDVACFVLRRPPGLSFKAGQNIKAGLPGRGRHRYSIASAPDDPALELCIERVPGGRLTPSLFELGVGGRIELADRAGGSFALDERATRHLMVATVTGIAPFRSMVRDAQHRGLALDVTVVHGASYVDDLPYRDELEASAAAGSISYVPTVSRPGEARNAGWPGSTGRADDVALGLAATFDPATTRVYACGHGGMVERIATEMGSRGFKVSTEPY
jgi:NAD(P)H-flavin reductase